MLYGIASAFSGTTGHGTAPTYGGVVNSGQHTQLNVQAQGAAHHVVLIQDIGEWSSCSGHSIRWT